MKRNLKALGLAMVAAFALTAVAASAAQAATHHVTVPTVPAIITATEEETTSAFKITAGAHEVHCEAKFEATITEKTNKEITTTPTFKKCKVDGSIPTIEETIDVNHCAFVLKGTTDVNGHAAVEIECAPENEITITYKVFGEECIVHVPAQTPKKGVHYTGTTNPTTGKKDITIKATAEGIKYTETRKAGGFFCPATATKEDGTFEGIWTAQAWVDKDEEKCKLGEATAKTTPPSDAVTAECEKEVQDLELTENATEP